MEPSSVAAAGVDEESSGEEEEKEKRRWSSRTENFVLIFFFTERLENRGLFNASSDIATPGTSLRDGFVLLCSRRMGDDGPVVGGTWCASASVTGVSTRTVNVDSNRGDPAGRKICESDRELFRERDPFLGEVAGG